MNVAGHVTQRGYIRKRLVAIHPFGVAPMLADSSPGCATRPGLVDLTPSRLAGRVVFNFQFAICNLKLFFRITLMAYQPNFKHSSSEHVLDEVDCYFHDALSPQMKKEIEEHCRHCEKCESALAAAKKRFELMKTSPPARPTKPLVKGTLQKIASFEDTPSRRPQARVSRSLRPRSWASCC